LINSTAALPPEEEQFAAWVGPAPRMRFAEKAGDERLPFFRADAAILSRMKEPRDAILVAPACRTAR